MDRFPAATDHLALAVPDVDAAAAEMAVRLGVAPSAGGRHAAYGTRNVLYSLGPRVYMELIGPDEEARVDGPRPFGIDALERPRLAGWCARSADLEADARAARTAGADPGRVRALSRRNPDGSELAWRMTPLDANPGDGLVPFLIDWGDAPHPAASAARGCALLELHGEHPDPGRIRGVLDAMGVPLRVDAGAEPALVARLDTPRGPIELR